MSKDNSDEMAAKLENVAVLQAGLISAAEKHGIRLTAFIEEIGGTRSTIVAGDDVAVLLASIGYMQACAQEIAAAIENGTIMTDRPTLN